MHALRPTLALVLLAALAGASSAPALGAGKLNVCSLLTAKQVAAIRGVSSKCANAKPAPGPGATIYVANWAGKTPTSPRVQVTVSLYADQGLLQLAKRNLKQGLPGVPRKVAGIGSAAFEATGASATGIRFAVGKYVALVMVTGNGKPSWSTKSVEALARAVAARL
jgi:hypothetical protein